MISVAPEAVALLQRLDSIDGEGLFWERFEQLLKEAKELIDRSGMKVPTPAGAQVPPVTSRTERLDPYRYQRDHDSSAGWRVAGPDNFALPVPDKMLALAIGKLLSGETEAAAEAAKSFLRYRLPGKS